MMSRSCSLTLSTQPSQQEPSYVWTLIDILTRVQPSIATATGRKYTLSKKEVEDATAALKIYNVCNFSFLMLRWSVVSLL